MIHIELPLSKSQINRALIIVAARGNMTEWLDKNPDIATRGCRDTRLLIKALNQFALGECTVDFHDAGTPCRLFTAFAASKFQQNITISGNPSLCSRRISPLMDALTQMGAQIQYNNVHGYPPFTVQYGIEEWRDVQISVAVSSQFASALLLVAPLFSGTKKITLTEISHSQSYVDLTIHCLKNIGIDVNSSYIRETREISVQGTYNSVPHPTREQFELESDWSSAAFFYPLLLGLKNTHSLLLEGLNLESRQGDVQLKTLGLLLGIETSEHEEGAVLRRINDTEELLQDSEDETMFVPMQDNPDLVPAMVVGWCILGKSVILQGIENLKYKECDRIAALQGNLAGINCSLEPWAEAEDLWMVNASNRTFPTSLYIETHDDHRIAMAFSALKPWVKDLTFSNTECVEKSFPNYWDQWKKCTFE